MYRPFSYCIDQAGLGAFTAKSGRMLEPNTYECPIRTIRTYWAEILIFDKKNELLSPIRTNGYDSQNLTGIDYPPSEN